MNLFEEKYGTPRKWLCPDCGVLFIIYPALEPFAHLCDKHIRGLPEPAFYYYQLDSHSGVTELRIENARDPDCTMEIVLDNAPFRCDKRWQGNTLIFHVPQGYDLTKGVAIKWNRRLQTLKPLPDAEIERRAMGNKVSA